MSVIDCLNTLLFDTNVFTTIIITFCLLVTAVVWISSGLFIRKLCISQDTITVRESNPIYFWSIICCTILLCLIPSTIIIDRILWVHYYHPYPHINYDTNACKNTNLLTLIQAISIPLTLVSAPSYCGLMCVYFQRLIIIFQNTAFQVSDKVKRYFILYIVVSFVSYVVIIVIEIVGIGTAGDPWSFLSVAQTIFILIYLLAYIIESFCICYLLRRQLFSISRSLEKMSSNANNGSSYFNNINRHDHDDNRDCKSQSYTSTGIELNNTNINTNVKTNSYESNSTSNYGHNSDRDRNYNSDHHSDGNRDHGGDQLQGAQRLQGDFADNINDNKIGSPGAREIGLSRSFGGINSGRHSGGVRTSQGKVCYPSNLSSQGALKDTNELFKKSKRLTILTYSTLVSTLISVIMIMLVKFIINNIRTGNMVLVVFIVCDVSINFACLSLQFSFADNIYNVLCQPCEKYQTFNKVEDVLTVTIVNNDNTKINSYRT